MKPSAVYGLPLLVGAALFVGTRALYQQERDRAREHWALAASAEAQPIASSVTETFQRIYEGLRTIARLPSVRRLKRGGSLDEDARTTAQEVYNNLAVSVAMSETYVLPVDFDPDAVDPATGKPQEPLTAFDELIVGRHADEHEEEHAAGEPEEIEIFEYRQMRAQLQRLLHLCPTEDSIRGLAYPALCSDEVITCDNRYYSAKLGNDRDRMGLVYSVPFFDEAGNLAGCISGVLLTRSLRDLLPDDQHAIVNCARGYCALPVQPGLHEQHLDDILRGRVSTDLPFSRATMLPIPDVDQGWGLWSGKSESDFEASPFAEKAESVDDAALAVSMVLVLALLYGMRQFARESERDRIRQQELERARDAAEAHARAKSNFVAVASHEIRTPMNGVLGMTELLLQGDLPPQQRELADTARRSARLLVDLLQGILDFSRLESGQLELAHEPFDPAAEAEDVAQLLAPVAAQNGLRLHVVVHDDVPDSVVGDAGRLRQVLTNLVGNAVKFTAHGSVAIHVRAAGPDRIRYEVVDTGIGLDPSLKARLFQPFVQADATTTRKFGGSGLGLAISRGLVAAMGGTIDYDPTPGGGTTFHFELPLAHASTPGTKGLNGQRIALVAPLPVERESLACALRRLGADVREFASREEALGSFAWATCTLADARIEDLPAASTIVRFAPLTASRSVDPNGRADRARLMLPARSEHLLQAIRAATGKPVSAGPPAVPSTQHQFHGRALVADDNEVNLCVATMMMHRLGFDCVSARDGNEAARLATTETFDVVLMDWQMPEVDGIEAAQRIREFERTHARTPVPILAVTANTAPEDVRRCLAAGMNGFLEKPISRLQLENALATVCQPKAEPTPR